MTAQDKTRPRAFAVSHILRLKRHDLTRLFLSLSVSDCFVFFRGRRVDNYLLPKLYLPLQGEVEQILTIYHDIYDGHTNIYYTYLRR